MWCLLTRRLRATLTSVSSCRWWRVRRTRLWGRWWRSPSTGSTTPSAPHVMSPTGGGVTSDVGAVCLLWQTVCLNLIPKESLLLLHLSVLYWSRKLNKCLSRVFSDFWTSFSSKTAVWNIKVCTKATDLSSRQLSVNRDTPGLLAKC